MGGCSDPRGEGRAGQEQEGQSDAIAYVVVIQIAIEIMVGQAKGGRGTAHLVIEIGRVRNPWSLLDRFSGRKIFSAVVSGPSRGGLRVVSIGAVCNTAS